MKKWIYIGIVAVFSACATYQQPLADDAYYWPDETVPEAQSIQRSQNIQNTQNTQSAPKSPAMEVLNRQDTTITVRIKR